jgi:RNA polymerase-binding transcription factor DksA
MRCHEIFKGFNMSYERQADALDEAAQLTATLTEGAIEAARRANAPEIHPDFDGETCLDCGNDIPAGRLALGKIRCVECQSIREHRGRQSARPGWNAGSVALDPADSE